MKKTISVILVITIALLLFKIDLSQAGPLKPFVSDGCSVFPDGTFEQKELWLSCCIQHDYDYWQGGTRQQRLNSDETLKTCVAKVGQPEIAALMLAGVRVGGTPYLPTKFRWGYGWSYPKLYGPLSVEEQQQVEKLQVNLDEVLID